MEELERRVAALERSNRRLKLFLVPGMAFAVFAALGWQALPGVQPLIQAHTFQVVDNRGVPLLTLSGSRSDQGGNIVFRDSSGDRRAWFTCEGQSVRLGMLAGRVDAPMTTAGMSVTPNEALVNVYGKSAAATIRVTHNKPLVNLTNSAGKVAFRAPWQK